MVGALKAPSDWKQSGTIYLWRYIENQRNYPGWHLALDSPAQRSIDLLVQALLSHGGSPLRTLLITPPTHRVLKIPNNRGGAATWQSPLKLRLGLDATNPDAWRFDEDKDVVVWTFGARTGVEVAALFGNPSAYFDQSIGSNPVVWSWGLIDAAA